MKTVSPAADGAVMHHARYPAFVPEPLPQWAEGMPPLSLEQPRAPANIALAMETINNEVVTKVVTGLIRGRFEPEKWGRLRALIPPPDDGIRSTCACLGTFCLRNQAYIVHISRQRFYHSTHKAHDRSHPCSTSKW